LGKLHHLSKKATIANSYCAAYSFSLFFSVNVAKAETVFSDEFENGTFSNWSNIIGSPRLPRNPATVHQKNKMQR